jgi:hypothetical protein
VIVTEGLVAISFTLCKRKHTTSISCDVALKFIGMEPFNAEWTTHQDILLDWPLVITWLDLWLWIGPSKSKLLYDWQSVNMSWYRVPLWDLRPDIISCQNVAVLTLPLWQEDGSGICSVTTQWSELLITHNHIMLSHLRLPHYAEPDPCIYVLQEQEQD